MAKVFNTRMVAHLWANQSQAEARNSGGTFYFTEDTIYSYGSHFPIAKHVTNRGGERAVLFTTRGYSITTSGHKCAVLNAISRGTTIFHIPLRGGWVSTPHEDALDSYQERIVETARKARRSTANRTFLLNRLEELVAEGNAYSRFFGLRKRFKVPTEVDLERLRREAERAAQKERKRQQERQEQALRAAAETVAKWKAGEDVRCPYVSDEVFLRVRADKVETSLGAEVPLEHAKRLLPLIRSGKAYERNGHTVHVGHFALDRIDAEGNIKVGCHSITREEIERVAAQLGL